MEHAVTASYRKIFLFGHKNLENSILIGSIYQNTGIECQHIDISCWLDRRASETDQILVLIDADSASPTRVQELVSRLYDSDVKSQVAIFNVSEKHSFEQLLNWPNLNGLFCTDTSQKQLGKGIEKLFEGELWLPRRITSSLIKRLRGRPRSPTGVTDILTKREKQILNLTATGATNAEVAEILNVSMHTVKTHVYNLFRKIGVTNRIQAVNWANDHLQNLSDDEHLQETSS